MEYFLEMYFPSMFVQGAFITFSFYLSGLCSMYIYLAYLSLPFAKLDQARDSFVNNGVMANIDKSKNKSLSIFLSAQV